MTAFSERDTSSATMAAPRLPPGEGSHKAEHDEKDRRVQRMEFRTFVLSFMAIPAQFVKTGRRIVYRLLSWSEWQPVLFRWLSATRQ